MRVALLVLSGDFRQTLSVISKSTPVNKKSMHALKKLYLATHTNTTTNKKFRFELSKDKATAHFVQTLLQIGGGTYLTDQTTGLIELNNDFCNIATTEDELID
ncbi:ATP-dependent DNA helicase [Trichonephila inaurata madagascariensis]|uniref:ATP-dependent DNA helicase n=1 Tax=Trichonephila inaurata madagascariensis TaxID=2747483 RepID=A0A8X6XKW0_9ARAC|nr:ATP-dependent DNA helicase [Trichonephila inaurata madagascariensis]